jgi:choline-sulfatase
MHFNSELRHGFEVRVDSPEHRKWLAGKGRAAVPAGVGVLGGWRPFKDPAEVWLNARGLPLAMDADMDATYFAARAGEFLSASRERPFFLMVSFTQPHSPFNFAVEFAGKYGAEQFGAPAVDAADEAQIPKIFRGLTDEQKRGIAASYYTAVEYMDSKVGAVLEALEKSGRAGNTLVIYTGDHGYMLGQHGRFEKHCGYEAAVRSPLIIRGPGKVGAGGASGALVNFVDIVPTVLEVAGVATPANVQGRSLKPLLQDPSKAHRESVFIEYSENEEAYVVTERWKFIYGTGKRLREDGYETGGPLPGRTIMLFDLKGDPDERINLAARPEHADRVAGFTRQLADHMKATARQPELVPRTDDPHVILEHCLQPRDVGNRQ